MAENNFTEQILLEVQLQASEALTRMGELKEHIDTLKDKQKDLDTTTKEGQREFNKLASEIRVANKEMKDHQNTVDKANSMAQKYGDSMQEMKRKVSDLTKEFNNLSKEQRDGAFGKQLQAEIKKTHDELTKAEEAMGNYHREVGNYGKAIGSLGGPMAAAAGGIAKIGVALKALLAHPILAVIAAVIIAIKKIVDAFKRSEDSMNTLREAFSAFNPIIDAVKRAFDAFASLLAKGVKIAIDGVVKGIKGLAGLLDKLGKALGKDWGLAERWDEAAAAAQNLTKAEQDYLKHKRQFTEQEAKLENEIAKLKDKSVQKDKYTAEERIKFLEQAGAKEREIADQKVQLAKEELANLEAEAARGENNAEMYDRLAEARANVTRAETEYYQSVKKINAQIVAFKKEEESADKAAAATSDKLAQQDKKNKADQQAIAKAKLDYDLALLEKEKGANWQFTEESKQAHLKYYDDLANLYDKDSKEYLAAQTAKEKYEANFNKTAEQRAKQRENILAKYNIISPTQHQLAAELKELADAHDQGIISEEEYAQQVASIYSDLATQKADSIASYGQQIMGVVDTITGAFEEQENAEMERWTADNDKKKDALKQRLDDGLISQESYDAQVAALDAEQEKKKKELDLKQAKRQKAMAIMNATLNAAGAIIASLAQSPVAIGPIPNPAGIASLALATTTGIAQIAAAAATPLPIAARGKLLNGPSHANGGIKIEAEGGEAIINKRSTQMFKPILSAINQAGGGVKFANGGMVDGGYAARQITNEMQLATSRDLQSLGDRIAALNVQVAVTDINQGQSNMARVQERKNY